MKKLLSFMLSLAVLSGTATITAFAEDVITETFGDTTIEVSQNGKCVKVCDAENNIEMEYGYGNMWIDGKVITDKTYTLTDEEWERLEKLTDITNIDPIEYMYFSDNVTEIDYQFSPGIYPQLKVIDFGSSLEKIGEYAFEYSATDRIYFSDSLKEIGEGAFRNCDNLYTVAIPENVETIGDYAFMDCNSLDNMVILSRNAVFGEKCMGYLYPDEDDLKSDITIRGYAGSTAETYALENGLNFIALPEDSTLELEISDTLKNIRIYDIISDIEYTFSDDVLTIDGKILDSINLRLHNDEFLTEQDKKILIGFALMIEDEVKEIIYTDNVTEIHDKIPVVNTKNITKITFGKNVAEIDNDVFYFLNPHTEIYGYSDTDAERIARENYLNFVEMTTDGDISKTVYYGDMHDIVHYEISEDKKTLSWEYPDYVNNHKHQVKDGIYTIDGTVIEDEQSVDIDELTDEELENLIYNVQTVHEWLENNPIEEVIFSDNVKEIYTYNRNNFVNSVKKLTFGENVEIIGEHTFSPNGDSQITEIVFGNKLKKIEWGAFCGLDKLTEIIIPESVEEIERDAFFACDSLSDITILSRNVVLGSECFGYVSGFPDAERADITIHGYKGSNLCT